MEFSLQIQRVTHVRLYSILIKTNPGARRAAERTGDAETMNA